MPLVLLLLLFLLISILSIDYDVSYARCPYAKRQWDEKRCRNKCLYRSHAVLSRYTCVYTFTRTHVQSSTQRTFPSQFEATAFLRVTAHWISLSVGVISVKCQRVCLVKCDCQLRSVQIQFDVILFVFWFCLHWKFGENIENKRKRERQKNVTKFCWNCRPWRKSIGTIEHHRSSFVVRWKCQRASSRYWRCLVISLHWVNSSFRFYLNCPFVVFV